MKIERHTNMNGEYRFFAARSGVEVRDQLIKAILEKCVDQESRAFERMVRALGANLSTRSRKYRFKVGEKTTITQYFKSVIAIHGKEAVGIIFIEKEDVWVYVKPEHRRKLVATYLWKTIIKFCPDIKYGEAFRLPWPLNKTSYYDSIFSNQLNLPLENQHEIR